MRPTPKHYFWMLLIVLLTACNLRQVYDPAPTATATVPQPTATASPTIPPSETPTPGPTATQTRTPFPTEKPLPLVKVDGLRVAYILEGNLYVQDSGGEPRQLTSSGKDFMPRFSEDGEKIIFFRGGWDQPNDVYVINIDGTQEHILVNASLLMALDGKYSAISELGSSSLIPGTPKLLFDTQEFEPNDNFRDGIHHQYSKENHDLLTVDINTFEIKRIFSIGKSIRFPSISPDGKLMTDDVSLFRTNGELVHKNLMSYRLGNSYLFNKMPADWTFWAPDSSKVITLPPTDSNADPSVGPMPRTIWQHFVDGRQPIEIHLEPPPTEGAISPDRNFIIYTHFGEDKWKTGLYLGNLRDGTTQLLREAVTHDSYLLSWSSSWSPDNTHFIVIDYRDGLYLGDIHGKIVPIKGRWFLGWLDDTHYLYGGLAMGEIGKEDGVSIIEISHGDRNWLNYDEYPSDDNLTYIYIKPK